MLLLSKKYRQQNLDILGRIPNWIIRVMDEKRQLGFKQFASFEYACLIEAFSQNPDTEYDAMQLLDPLVDRLESGKDFKDIRLMYHSAMKGFMQYFNIRSVMTIVSKMSQHATKLADAKKYDVVKYVQPDSTTWEMVISLFEERKMRSAMVRTWVGMLSRGEAPTVSIQRSMVKTLALQGRLEEAELVMRIGRVLGVGLHKEDKDQARRQKSLSWELNTKISSLASNLSAINSIVIPLKEPRVFKREDIDSLKVDGPDELGPIDSVIYGILISSAITYKNIQVAKQLFTEMQSEHVITDAKAFSYLANIYLHDQKTNKLQELINEYLSAKNRNNSKTEIQASKVDVEVVHSDIDLIGPLLYFYVESGEIFRAKELLDEWDQSYQDKIPAFELGYALLKIYRAANESKKGLLIFETSISATRRKNTDKGDESEKPKLELRHYVVMLRAAMDIKDLPKCVEILKLMDKNKVLPNQKIMETLLYTFLNAQALDLFDIAYDYIHNVLNMPLSMPLYTKWMKVLANHGDVYGIRNVLNDMDMMGQAPETHHYAILMQTLALCGHHDQAVEVLTQLKDVKSSVRPNADIYIAMIESSVINGQIKEAEQRLGALLEGTLMPPGRIPPRAFNNVMLGYLYHGDGSSAARIYRRMLDVGVKPNAHTYSALMHAYAWEGELETCKQLLNDMITRGVQPDPVIYTIMIVAFSMKADVRGAQRIFQQMCDQRNKWVVYRHIQKSKPGWPLGKHHSEIPTSKFVSDQNNDEDKEEMPPQPFVIDPVVYITMLKLYNNSKNLRKAIDMWSSLLSDYPVLRWNPRTGGQAKLAPTEVTAKTISYTSDFHKSALHILLRTFRASLKVNEIMDNPDKALDYMVNMEINKADTTESDVPLTEKDFWASTSMHGFEKKKSDEQSGLLEPLQIIDAMMRIWQRLEQIKFQFDNVHLNGYLSCLVVTRQYEELIRVLGNSVTTQSRVLTKLPASKNTAKVSKSTTLPPLSFDEDIARPSMPRLTITPQNTYLLLDRFRVDDFIDQHRRKHTPRNGKRRNDSKDPDIDGGQTLYLDFDNQSNRVISGGLLPELSKQEKKWQEETRARVIEMWSKHITIGGLWMLRNKDKL
ncbi:hypothetical protein H4219_005419 [Mycoemilia scoparia]|uniref:Pentacotripeptide-repeat region of PRORP domain-containing protein n=1 Tax=Mycoemilia scoparia TaxID=417184 RepID=A0A9W8DPK0_9FUNG|nr:hypothetical protein H4219_005419 [Mycoemilia scoparia]